MDCRRWGFIIRNNLGDVVLAEVKQALEFLAPELEEARACYFALSTTIAHGFRTLVMEADSQELTSMLYEKDVLNNLLVFISDTLSLSIRFNFLS